MRTTGGHLTAASCTHKRIFGYHDTDIGEGPLCNGATPVMFEGCPTLRTSAGSGPSC